MMKIEFEQLAGYEVTDEDYSNIIEPMYMATNLDKDEFIKTLNRKRFEVKKEKSEAQLLLEDSIKEEIKMLEAEIKWHQNRVKMFEPYLQDDDKEFWKNEIKTAKYEIKLLKNRVATLKWVLA